ncbi:MAG: conjugal transfer protein TraF [Candidatus Zhuqueibacterota bacterium]
MKRTCATLFLSLLIATCAWPQITELPHQFQTAKTVFLGYPVNSFDVRALGMGNAQIANPGAYNAMMYNPALLGHKRHSVEIFGIQAGMPSATYDAANYLSQHISEFEEAISLNQIYDGLAQLTEPGASNAQKLQALHDIQDGLVFVNDLFVEVTGPSEAPKTHGISFLPGMSAQFGNLGFSLYGLGQAGFVVQLSPTFESLMDVEIPSTLDNPLAVAQAAIQLTAALAPAVTGPREFSDQAFPTAYYSSYFDIVAAVGYGMPITKNFTIGANLKIINRRFLLDRVAVEDYDEIISSIWNKFKSDVTGVTGDIGAQYQFKFGTSVGATFQNVFPMKEITKTISSDFQFYRLIPRSGQTDSLVTWGATITRPFELKAPFIMSLGISHPLTQNWDIAIDWVDIAENDTRFEQMEDRIGLGTEYRFTTLNNALTIAPRLGMSDQRIALGLGLKIVKFIHIDGAYAFDRFVNEFAYYTQLKIGW